MKPPTQIFAASTIVANVAEKLAAKHEEVPQEKLAVMVVRTGMGLVLTLLGVALLVGLVGIPLFIAVEKRDTGVISMPLVTIGLAAGIGLVAWGSLMASGQLAAKPLALAIAAFKGVYTTIRPPKG